MTNTQAGLWNTNYSWSHDLIKSQQAAHQLVIYRGLLKDKVVTSFLDLLQTLTSYPSTVTETLNAYHKFLHNLIGQPTSGKWPNAWQRYLVTAVLADENPFSRQAEYLLPQDISPSLREAARHDLTCLQRIYLTPADSIKQAVLERIGQDWAEESELDLPSWENMTFSEQESNENLPVLLNSTSWGEDIDKVAAFYHTNPPCPQGTTTYENTVIA